MRFCDLRFVLNRCAVSLRSYADYLKDMDKDNDTTDLASIYEHIESFDYEYDSMTLKDLDACLTTSFWHLLDFVELLQEREDHPDTNDLDCLIVMLDSFLRSTDVHF